MLLNFRLRPLTLPTIITIAAYLLPGCSAYTTPGGGISLFEVASNDVEIQERFDRKPAARFPAHLAVARIQRSGYRSHTVDSYGEGRYSVVTTRDIETAEDFQKIQNMPKVAAVAPISRLMLPEKLRSEKDLRTAAASLRADMLLLYSFDTHFETDQSVIAPLRVIHLGLLPDQTARIVTTASALLLDVRTGFIYGSAEASEKEQHITSAWTNADVADAARRSTERRAFSSLLTEFENTWAGVLKQQ